jgi:hypothetical protein
MADGPPRQAQVTLNVDATHPGTAIPEDFAGLSFEMETLLPSATGSYYFDKSNHALIDTLHNLGVKSLRIGGNTADRPTLPFPGATDVDSLMGFARAASAKVIFTFRLREGGPQNAAPLATHLMNDDSSLIDCFEIGNEPDIYVKTYNEYRSELNRYISAFDQFGVSRNAKFCGPGTTPSEAEWARNFSQDFGQSPRIRFVTQHAYPGNSGRSVSDASAGRSAILSSAWVRSYDSFYRSFAYAAQASHLPYRIEETNSYFNGGAKDVSDTFASALWGLDYMYWWAVHGAAGINFHTGERVAAADETTKCFYAVFLASRAGYAIQPLGYAMKAFDIGGHGRIVPVQLTKVTPALDLTTYAVVVAENHAVYITLINKEHGAAARDALVTIDMPGIFSQPEVIRLQDTTSDIAAKAGITLGGEPIGANGLWNGQWRPLGSNGGPIKVKIPMGSAAIVKFSAKTTVQ